MRFFFFSLSWLFLFSISSTKADEMRMMSMACGTQIEVEHLLKDKYHESTVTEGMLSENDFIRFYRSEKGTFTVILVTSDGLMCIMGAGLHSSLRSQPILGKAL